MDRYRQIEIAINRKIILPVGVQRPSCAHVAEAPDGLEVFVRNPRATQHRRNLGARRPPAVRLHLSKENMRSYSYLYLYLYPYICLYMYIYVYVYAHRYIYVLVKRRRNLGARRTPAVWLHLRTKYE